MHKRSPARSGATKAKTETYCQLDSLSEQIDEAARAKDTKKVEALTERANELEKHALNDADPNSKDVQDKYQ